MTTEVRSRDTHHKWVVAVVSGGIIAALGTFAMLDRNGIAARGIATDERAHANQRRIEVLEQRTDVRLKNIEGDVGEIKAMLREIQRDGR